MKNICHIRKESNIRNISETTQVTNSGSSSQLIDLVNTERIVPRYLPKQTDIDKILKVIQRKVLKGTHLPITIKEIQAGYLNSPYVKDLYLYLRIDCQVQKVLYAK